MKNIKHKLLMVLSPSYRWKRNTLMYLQHIAWAWNKVRMKNSKAGYIPSHDRYVDDELFEIIRKIYHSK